MTRTEKYAQLRASIELENLSYMFTHLDEYMELRRNQEKIKKEKGCKH